MQKYILRKENYETWIEPEAKADDYYEHILPRTAFYKASEVDARDAERLAEIAKLKEALIFYADAKQFYVWDRDDKYHDNGNEVARKALAIDEVSVGVFNRRIQMSLYNMLFGVNPAADFLLAMLGIDRSFPPRFRDCYIDGNHIVIYTRTGGGNREEYEGSNEEMHELPGFVSDVDDDFDCTYAHFTYTPPEKFKAEFEILRDMGGEKDPRKSWESLLSKLGDPAKKDDPEVVKALEKMAPTMEKLKKALDGSGPTVVEV